MVFQASKAMFSVKSAGAIPYHSSTPLMLALPRARRSSHPLEPTTTDKPALPAARSSLLTLAHPTTFQLNTFSSETVPLSRTPPPTGLPSQVPLSSITHPTRHSSTCLSILLLAAQSF